MMARRLTFAFLLLLAGLALVAGALVLWRVPLAQAVADRQIAALGLAGARVTVAEVWFDHLRLADVSAGAAGELSAESVVLRYRLADLWERRITSAEVTGPTVRLDLRRGAAPLASLQTLLGGDTVPPPDESAKAPSRAEAAGPALPFDRVTIRRGRVEALTPAGPVDLAVHGELATGAEGGLSGRLDVAGNDLAFAAPEVGIAALSGEITVAGARGFPGSASAAVHLGGLRVSGARFEAADLRLDLNGERAELTGRLRAEDRSVDLSLVASAEDLTAAPRVDVNAEVTVAADAPVWRLAAPPLPTGGELHLALSGSGQLPPLSDGPLDAAWLSAAEATGRLVAEVAELTRANAAGRISADLDLATAWSGGALTLTAERESRLAVRGLTAADLVARGVPSAWAGDLARISGGSVTLTLAAEGASPSRAILRPAAEARRLVWTGSAALTAGAVRARLSGRAEAELAGEPRLARADLDHLDIEGNGLTLGGAEVERIALTGTLAGAPAAFEATTTVEAVLRRLAVGEASAEGVRLTLPLRAAGGQDAVSITVAEAGRVTFGALQLAGGLNAARPVGVTIEQGEARLRPGGGAGSALAGHAVLALDETAFALARGEGPPLALQVHAPRIVLDARGLPDTTNGSIDITGATLRVPELEAALEGIAARLTLPADPAAATARLTVEALRHLAEPPAVAPISLTAEAKREGDGIAVTGQVVGPEGTALADLTARHDLAGGTGHAELHLAPLSFAPGGLQPSALSPRLAQLADVSGAVDGAARLTWDRDGLAGTADLALNGVAFATENLTVEGLDVTLALDRLDPPSSAPGQRLQARRIDVGVPIEGLEARFRLPPDAPGKVLVEQARFALPAGRFAVRDGWVDPAAARGDVRLLVDRLDLETLFERVAIEGLSGTGELAGSVPVRLDGEALVIDGARLEARGPGVLRFHSDTASRALAGGGEYVELMLEALEDFQYETLAVSGGLDPDGEADMRLEILGSNPDVLEGHPFQLNINLAGNLGPILEAVRQGRAISSDILRRAWRLAP